MNVAAAAAVIAVAVIIARIALPTSAPSPGVQPSAAATEPGIAGTAVATVGPRALFMMQLASDSDLPQKARGVFLDNLRMIHEDILRTHAAVKKYPGDINLRGLLFNLYQQQARLLNEAQRAQIQTTTRITV